MREERLLQGDTDCFECILPIAIVILLGYVMLSFNPEQEINMKLVHKGTIYFNTSLNSSDIIEEFSDHYDQMFIELTAFNNFSFIVQYQFDQGHFRYDYVCDRVDFCQRYYEFAKNYEVIGFMIRTYQEHNIIKGGYLLLNESIINRN
jgi:hypothetical protein